MQSLILKFRMRFSLNFTFQEKLSIAEKRREEVSESPVKMVNLMFCTLSFRTYSKVLGKVVEAAKEEDKKVLLVRQNKAKILKVFVNQHSSH